MPRYKARIRSPKTGQWREHECEWTDVEDAWTDLRPWRHGDGPAAEIEILLVKQERVLLWRDVRGE